VVAAAGLILRDTEIRELYVFVLALLSVGVAGACLSPRLSAAALRRGFIIAAVGFLAVTAIMITFYRNAFARLCSEDNVVEWLTADCLLAAWVFGFILTVRLARRGTPSPMAAFLTTGCFWGFWRELEWGSPFFGGKLIYTRNFFRIKAFYSTAFFEHISRDKGVSTQTLLFIHWAAVLISLAIACLLLTYMIHHRRILREELRQLAKAPCGRYFLWALGVGLAAEALGALFHRLVRWGYLAGSSRAERFPHFVLEEPLELLATAFLVMSVISLWQQCRAGRTAVPSPGLMPAPGRERLLVPGPASSSRQDTPLV